MKKFSQFKNSEDGVVAIIVAITLVSVLLGVLALSIDANRTQVSYGKNQNSTDAAALATAEWILKGKSNGILTGAADPLEWEPEASEIKEHAERVLLQNFRLDHANSEVKLAEATFEVEYDKTRINGNVTRHSVRVAACTELDTPVAASSKKAPQTRTCTDSTAAFDIGKLENAEVAFALDFTESMYWEGRSQDCSSLSVCPTFGQSKAKGLVDTMGYVLDTYFPTDDDSTAYASIIPYTSFVNTYPFNYRANLVDSSSSQPSWENNVFEAFNSSKYIAFNNTNVRGPSLHDYEYVSPYHHFYTSLDSSNANTARLDACGFAPITDDLRTDDLTYVLERVPVLDANKFGALMGSSDTTSQLPFDNYAEFIEDFDSFTGSGNVVFDLDSHRSHQRDSNGNIISGSGYNTFSYRPLSCTGCSCSRSRVNLTVDEAEDAYRRGYCYNGMIAAAADQRIERKMGRLNNGTYNNRGVVQASPKINDINDGRRFELHESYPIQPLTNKHEVLKQVLNRFVSNTALYPGEFGDYGTSVMNRQSRLNKAADLSTLVKTQSMQGLLWAWFTIDNNWQGRWDGESLHEEFCGDGGLPCTGEEADSVSSRASLPSDENQKHIILISDGYDVDGLNELTGKFGATGAGAETGVRNSCDAYSPIDRFTYDQYSRLCTKLADEDIKVHIILYDFQADAAVLAADGGRNRYLDCTNITNGEFFENVRPTGAALGAGEQNLQDALDTIFAGIITDIVPVRLVE